MSYKYYEDSWGMKVNNLNEENSIQVLHEMTHKHKSSIDTLKEAKFAVLLNCEGRSGSTWLSSFFWKNPDVFYIYEPLYPLPLNTYAKQKAHLKNDYANMLQVADIANCNLDNKSGKTMFPMVLGRYPYYQPALKHCKENDDCPETLTLYCQSKSHIVQKVIRFYNISYYQQLQNQLEMPMKIVHLIRDPRPHIISREKYFKSMFDDDLDYSQLSDIEKSEERRKLCLRELENLKFGDSSIFNKDSYLRISHEEMSLDPINWARRIYQFTGLDFNEETKSYIKEITNGKSLVKDGKDPDGRHAGFSVYRDTLTVLYKWMSSKPEHIHDIEKECKEVIDYLGYVNVYDDKLNLINKNPWPRLVNNEDIPTN